jgi:diguanylate cyclase (GGDEF)-like protein/PAS domain S-box-containing protein
MDNAAAVGIWTERDALAIDFSDASSFARPIREVMSSPVRSVQAGTLLQDVALRFRKEHVRHYLVTGVDGDCLGVVSQTDVVLNHGVEHYLRLRRVDSVMRGPLLTLAANESLGAAARRMRSSDSDALAVEYPDGDYGILTERDVVRLIASGRSEDEVGRLASRPLISIDRKESLYRARSVLMQHGVRHIGITRDGGALDGILSFSDLLAGMELVYVQELRHALKVRNRALKFSQRSLRLAEKVIENSLEGIIVTDREGFIETVNPAFSRLTGYRPEEVIGRNPSLLSSGRHDRDFYRNMWHKLAEGGHWQGEIWNRRKDGEVYPELLTITAIADETGEVTHYAALFSDISELKENEKRIKHLAYFDPLTGLPNRRLFADRLQMGVAHSHRNGQQLAVLFVDLDRFKRVNDSLGHAVGDSLLREVSGRIEACIREDDTVARMGGDEFTVLLSEVRDFEEAAQVARRIIERLEQPVLIEGNELVVTSSIGISYYPDDGPDPDTLIRNADTAMYRAKADGRNSYQLYTPSMNARSREHLSLEVALRRALDRDELRLFYQPLHACASGALAEAEALLRWEHPERGLMTPADFVPLAEETGLIEPIGEWVVATACRQLRTWLDQGFPAIKVAVNISARQFQQPEFAGALKRNLDRFRVPAGALNLELTETLLMEDGVEVIRMLNRIRDLGVGISVDDFGTGYSSLNYLKRFPIRTLKIDQAFIRDISSSPEDEAIVSAVINLAHSLRLEVVAEGVEREEQLALLKRHGCDLIQGFLYGPALPPELFQARFLTDCA